jgi:DNA-binding NarL/FixJ family response regulator
VPENERILIGLRDTLIAEAFSRLLSEAGFDVTGPGEGPAAVVVSQEGLAAARERWPEVPIIALLGDIDGPTARALVRHAVNGVIPLAAHSSEATRIVREVLDGHVVYPRGFFEHLEEPELLSERQREVLEQVALGRSNDEIAERPFISRNTVRFHLREIYVRLGVRNRVEAVRAGVTETA